MTEAETGFVYTLTDPRTDEVRYVGATKNPEERLESHVRTPHSDALAEWISDLEADGATPEMRIIDVRDVQDLSDAEQSALDQLSERFELLNSQRSVRYNDGNSRTETPAGVSLNQTDRSVLDVLRGGRVTPQYVADEADVSRTYASERIKRLLEHGHVEKLAPGLYELVDDPREDTTTE